MEAGRIGSPGTVPQRRLARADSHRQGPAMNDIQPLILAAVQRAPQWVRHDLVSTEATIRARAEEAMAAIIAQALHDADHPSG